MCFAKCMLPVVQPVYSDKISPKLTKQDVCLIQESAAPLKNQKAI